VFFYSCRRDYIISELRTMSDKVILVNDKDEQVGTANKLEAHQQGGTLHRAFSVFIFNRKGEMLLQQRAEGKYHSGGLWTNTCCSHPRPGEPTKEAAERRLEEEMGFTCDLKEVFSFTYRAEFEDLTEHEYDHVFFGICEPGEIEPDPEEAGDWKWVSRQELEKDVKDNPKNYTPWFKQALDRVLKEAQTRNIIS